jgi:hypothetical protein
MAIARAFLEEQDAAAQVGAWLQENHGPMASNG